MKVLGCDLRNIQMLFLLEAAYIGLIGGVVGLAFSYGISALINRVGAVHGKCDDAFLHPALAGPAFSGVRHSGRHGIRLLPFSSGDAAESSGCDPQRIADAWN